MVRVVRNILKRLVSLLLYAHEWIFYRHMTSSGENDNGTYGAASDTSTSGLSLKCELTSLI